MKTFTPRHLNLCKTLLCALLCLTLIFSLTSCMNLNSPKKYTETGSVQFTINDETISRLENSGIASRAAGYDRSATAPVISMMFTIKNASGDQLIRPVTESGTLSELNGKTIILGDIPLNTAFTVSVSCKVNGREFLKGTSEQITLETKNTKTVEIELEYANSSAGEIISYISLCGTWAFDYGWNQDVWADDQITFYPDGTFETHYITHSYSEWDTGTYSVSTDAQGQQNLNLNVLKVKQNSEGSWQNVDVKMNYTLSVTDDEFVINRFKRDSRASGGGIEYCDPPVYNHAYRVANAAREMLIEDKWTSVKSNDYWDNNSFTWTFSADGTMHDFWTSEGTTQDFPGRYKVYQEGEKTMLYQFIDFGGSNQEAWYSITSLGPNILCLVSEKIITCGEEEQAGYTNYAYRDVPLVEYTYHWKVNDGLEYTFKDYWPKGESYTLLDLSNRSMINGLPDTYIDQALLGWHVDDSLSGGRVKSIPVSSNTVDRDFYAEWGLKGHHNGDDEDYCWSTGVPAKDLFDSISFNENDMIIIHFEADLSNDINGWTEIKF